MDKVIKFLDYVMYFSYAHTWSFMDVIVFLVIIPALCNAYSFWLLLLVFPWIMYSNHQANKWNNWSE